MRLINQNKAMGPWLGKSVSKVDTSHLETNNIYIIQ